MSRVEINSPARNNRAQGTVCKILDLRGTARSPRPGRVSGVLPEPSRRKPFLSAAIRAHGTGNLGGAAGVPERIALYGLTARARSRTIGAGNNGWGVADAWDAAVATSGCVGLRGVVLELPLE
jgi:hypothetical protein